jgi:hypothetical protein
LPLVNDISRVDDRKLLKKLEGWRAFHDKK